jgi:hypothetical protein
MPFGASVGVQPHLVAYHHCARRFDRSFNSAEVMVFPVLAMIRAGLSGWVSA